MKIAKTKCPWLINTNEQIHGSGHVARGAVVGQSNPEIPVKKSKNPRFSERHTEKPKISDPGRKTEIMEYSSSPCGNILEY